MSEPRPLTVARIDARTGDPLVHLGQLRDRLSPRGDVVSEAGRQRTIEVFGEPLSPQQVVERIVRDVRERGRSAVLELTKKLDKAGVTAETLRVPAERLAAA
ncbi:MAG TPA: histidinol dehydrogenase, partial [Pirellulaceae bacterium]|nr:histidinol dehydrogenase [Pirellulaceae bacterium]